MGKSTAPKDIATNFLCLDQFKQGTQNTIGSTLFGFRKSKQMICLLEGWIRQKTETKPKQMYFIPKTTQLIFGGLYIKNKQCSTFTFMYLEFKETDLSYPIPTYPLSLLYRTFADICQV